MQYHVQQNGKKFGPYTEKDIIALRDAGKISRATLLSPDKVHWTNASEFDWLYPPPKGQQSQDDTSSAGVAGKTAAEKYREYRQAGASEPTTRFRFMQLNNFVVGIVSKIIGLLILIILAYVAYKAAMHFLPADIIKQVTE
ncbi:MAG: DUF4339 domain-containing protein [Planctomycetaceae bacterium]|nr:DUF4339 domain-containing protein [Planctomycetaceae bacterium]